MVELMPFVVVGLMALGWYLFGHWRHRREKHAYQRLVTRDRLLEPTMTPLGLGRQELRARWECLPEGDRHHGVEHAVEGTVPTTVADRSMRLDCAAFRWWWEQRDRNQNHSSRGYDRQATTVAAVRLPAAVPTAVRLRPESVLGRLGVTRGGRQVESSEFNRRFRVACADDRLAVMFLDAHMQTVLTREFPGRSIELVDDVLVLEGSPSHRDDSLAGAIGELPAVRQDAARLVAAVSEQVWRQLGVTPSEDAAGPATMDEVSPAAGPAPGGAPTTASASDGTPAATSAPDGTPAATSAPDGTPAAADPVEAALRDWQAAPGWGPESPAAGETGGGSLDRG